jgi:hypothetical protein
MVAALALGACGGDDGGKAGDATSSATSASTSPAADGSAGGKLSTSAIDQRLDALESCLADLTGTLPTKSTGTDPGYIKVTARSGKPMDVYVFSTAAAAEETAGINRTVTPDAVIRQFGHALVTLNGNPADEQRLALDCGRRAA